MKKHLFKILLPIFLAYIFVCAYILVQRRGRVSIAGVSTPQKSKAQHIEEQKLAGYEFLEWIGPSDGLFSHLVPTLVVRSDDYVRIKHGGMVTKVPSFGRKVIYVRYRNENREEEAVGAYASAVGRE